ncbi:DUF1564 domain-containing protein [Leptospira barantonii]|uniref:DUF1564 domain-containing protein n=1 Tax=Leptospira barantonii TaxID=2023184 RepID=A0A5F2B087_9LEPT|nr:DUF1564 domain-containing protein [Leptospira barantonii]TGL97854.1 DUF1564 domain-containing protein [Leptospira barantonii]
MGAIILSENQKVRTRLTIDGVSSVETFLIPEEYWARLSPEGRKQLPEKIRRLLRRFGKYIIAMHRLNPKPGKTMYQRDRGRLVRFNVRMSTALGAILGSFAASHGVSRCFLVNYLLWMDEVGIADSIFETVSVGTPSFHDLYRNILTLDLSSNTITREFIFEPNPIYAQDLDFRSYFPPNYYQFL